MLSLLINTCECRLSGKPTLRTICPDCLWLGGSTLEPQVDSCSNLANSSCSATFVLTREICIESLDVKLAMFGDRGPPLVDCAPRLLFLLLFGTTEFRRMQLTRRASPSFADTLACQSKLRSHVFRMTHGCRTSLVSDPSSGHKHQRMLLDRHLESQRLFGIPCFALPIFLCILVCTCFPTANCLSCLICWNCLFCLE